MSKDAGIVSSETDTASSSVTVRQHDSSGLSMFDKCLLVVVFGGLFGGLFAEYFIRFYNLFT